MPTMHSATCALTRSRARARARAASGARWVHEPPRARTRTRSALGTAPGRAPLSRISSTRNEKAATEEATAVESRTVDRTVGRNGAGMLAIATRLMAQGRTQASGYETSVSLTDAPVRRWRLPRPQVVPLNPAVAGAAGAPGAPRRRSHLRTPRRRLHRRLPKSTCYFLEHGPRLSYVTTQVHCHDAQHLPDV
jgi:hypothetical protein